MTAAALSPVEAVILAAVQTGGRNASVIANDTGIPAETIDRIASELACRGLMNWCRDFGEARYSSTTPGRDAVRALAD